MRDLASFPSILCVLPTFDSTWTLGAKPTGNVVCPETGYLEFYFEGLTGSRQGGIAYARIPAARVRGAVSALVVAYNNDNENVLVIPHGANRGIGIAVQATTHYLMLNAQADGNFNIRIAHIG